MQDRARRTWGLTLIEMTLVVATIALLIGLALPAVRALVHSFQSEAGVRSMVSSALSAARAMAIKQQRYVGVRIQMAYDRGAPNPDDPLAAPQYMVFIIHDPGSPPDPNDLDYPDRTGTGYANGFRAIGQLKPVKLPDAFGVMDLTVVERTLSGNNQISISEFAAGPGIETPADLPAFALRLRDMTTFSLVFSPSGKLTVHDVRVWNRHGSRAGSATPSSDRVFNTAAQVVDPRVQAMFYQDDFPPETGLGPEHSRTNFVVVDRTKLRDAYRRRLPWTDCLQYLASQRIYVNPHTGTLKAPNGLRP